MKNISRNKNKYLIEIYKTKLGPIDYCNFKNYYRAIDLIKEPNNISKSIQSYLTTKHQYTIDY